MAIVHRSAPVQPTTSRRRHDLEVLALLVGLLLVLFALSIAARLWPTAF